MRRNEYISDRKMRFIFEVSPFQLLEAKGGDADFDLEDHRFCFGCERWYNAAYWIAVIEHEGQADFVCSGCADRFEKMTDEDKTDFLNACDRAFAYWKEELRCAKLEAA
jgi:hypothetical protein